MPLLLHHLNQHVVGVGRGASYEVDCLGPEGGSLPHELIQYVKSFQLHTADGTMMGVWRKLNQMFLTLEPDYLRVAQTLKPYFAADSKHLCAPTMVYMEFIRLLSGFFDWISASEMQEVADRMWEVVGGARIWWLLQSNWPVFQNFAALKLILWRSLGV